MVMSMFGQQTTEDRRVALEMAAGDSGIPRFSLNNDHIGVCMAAPWHGAFTREKNLSAWRKTGYSPFSRIAMHILADEEERTPRSRILKTSVP